MHPRVALLLPLLLAGCAVPRLEEAPAAPAPIEDADDLIRAMHARYADTWYRTLYFQQATSQVGPGDSVTTETWREWAAVPGRLRIEMGDPAAGNGALFFHDSTFYFQDGQQVAALPERNPLLLLGFDVYGQPPEETLRMLAEDGFPLGPVRTDTWEGRAAYVFGSPDAKEVWVDAERLVFVRLLEPSQQDPELQQDIRFTDYEPLDGGWIAPTVQIWVNGRKVFWEEYSDLRTGFGADSALFDPNHWNAPAPVPGR
jgi:hypothetical protein